MMAVKAKLKALTVQHRDKVSELKQVPDRRHRQTGGKLRVSGKRLGK